MKSDYKIGDCVKCDYMVEFLSNKIFTIIELYENPSGDSCFVLDAKIGNNYIFHYSYLYQDNDCIKKSRKLKLKLINGR